MVIRDEFGQSLDAVLGGATVHCCQRALPDRHCLDERAALGAANLTDNDPIRTRAQGWNHHVVTRNADSIRGARNTRLIGVDESVSPHACQIQFEVGLDSDDDVIDVDLADQRTQQRRLARSHTTAHHHVHVGCDRAA